MARLTESIVLFPPFLGSSLGEFNYPLHRKTDDDKAVVTIKLFVDLAWEFRKLAVSAGISFLHGSESKLQATTSCDESNEDVKGLSISTDRTFSF
ncbi:hypothetical protein TNCT_695681 [Trichonephila clavata]|uniref:Uncharacterized protein n=1 Tax=Trichonephila clavata TaxID=2740835 RepID=A0A8X6F949_TRICU|nr:hypothetical protein TNCT_695681 [Trichonephila clavata]